MELLIGNGSVLLAALLRFATSPWYDAYLDTTRRWGLDPIAEQQLAGAIMWVPAGLVYVAAGIVLIASSVRGFDVRGGDIAGDWGVGPAGASAELNRR